MRAVVMGRNYASRLGMARSAGRAGCEVTLVVMKNDRINTIASKLKYMVKTPDVYSRYVSEVFHAREPNQQELVDVLLTIADRHDDQLILLPCDDYVASTIDENLDVLSERYCMPSINMKQGEIARHMDKAAQKQLAQEAGLRTARGWNVKIHDGSYCIPDEVTYPCYAKPVNTNDAPKSFATKCDSRAELAKLLSRAANRSDCTILVEEFLTIEKEFGVLGYAEDGNAFIPAMVEKILYGNGHQNGITMLGKVCPADQASSTIVAIKKLIGQIGLTGLFDIDLCISNGQVYFIELNLRLGAFGYAVNSTFANLPMLFIRHCEGRDTEIPLQAPDAHSVTMVSEKVVLDEYCAGYMPWKACKDILARADESFILADDDKRPMQVFIRRIPLMHVKCAVKKALKKR